MVWLGYNPVDSGRLATEEMLWDKVHNAIFSSEVIESTVGASLALMALERQKFKTEAQKYAEWAGMVLREVTGEETNWELCVECYADVRKFLDPSWSRK